MPQNSKERLAIKFYRQGGLCALCGSQMTQAANSVDMNSFICTDATLDHGFPKCLRTPGGKGYNDDIRAVHLGCNQAKRADIIQFIPLDCYENPPGRGKLIEFHGAMAARFLETR